MYFVFTVYLFVIERQQLGVEVSDVTAVLNQKSEPNVTCCILQIKSSQSFRSMLNFQQKLSPSKIWQKPPSDNCLFNSLLNLHVTCDQPVILRQVAVTLTLTLTLTAWRIT